MCVGEWKNAFWRQIVILWAPSWWSWSSKLNVWVAFGNQCWILWGTNEGLRYPVATWKRFGKAWVGSGPAGDPDLGPTWVQLEAS